MHPEPRKTRDCAQADHVLQLLKLCRMSAEQEDLRSSQDSICGNGCVSMMRDLGVMLQQQGVEVKAKGLGDDVDSPSLKSSWMQRQAEPLQCDEVPDISDISQHQRYGCTLELVEVTTVQIWE